MAMHPALTVGFDLDMTLIDSRPGIKAAFEALSAATGVYVDADLAITRLGPPLADELAHWFPAEDIPAIAETYRNEIYPVHAIAGSPALPGARESIAAIHGVGGRAVVVTAKYKRNAERHLEHLDIAADAVVGDLWAEGKGAALIEHGATVYVGDHIGDVRGARTAGALSVAVATGPVGAAELRAAGADVVLADLTEFPEWFEGYVREAA
jgi:phosphoglycolate phosphatase